MAAVNLAATIGGSGDCELSKIGNTITEVLELEDIEIEAGELIDIDTEFMTIRLNNVSDVSSLTTESKFFNLYPGTNEFTVEPTTDPPGASIQFRVTMLWRDRYL